MILLNVEVCVCVPGSWPARPAWRRWAAETPEHHWWEPSRSHSPCAAGWEECTSSSCSPSHTLERERETHRERERERHRERERETERETETQRERQRHRERDRETETERETERERDRDTESETETQRERQRHRERDRERERETEREREYYMDSDGTRLQQSTSEVDSVHRHHIGHRSSYNNILLLFFTVLEWPTVGIYLLATYLIGKLIRMSEW